jgi:hypothetical protein
MNFDQQIAADIHAIRERLAPADQYSVQVKWNPQADLVVPTPIPKIITLLTPFNMIMVSLEQGTIKMVMGNVSSVDSNTIADFTFAPTANPLPIYLPANHNKIVSFWVDPNSPYPAKGNIWISKQ